MAEKGSLRKCFELDFVVELGMDQVKKMDDGSEDSLLEEIPCLKSRRKAGNG